MSESKSSLPPERIFLLDAHALCYRSFYAIKGLMNSKGQATGAVYGFVNTLKKILRDFEPHYMAVCFDAGKKTLRQEKFAEYKIHRQPMPDDLISQIPLIKEAVEAFNLPVFEMEGFEADDIIATLAVKAQKMDLHVVIVSDDKDMVQLMHNDHVKMFSTRKDTLLGPKDIKGIFGIEPEQIVDLIALAGDQADNIPGVMGVGDVTAKNLINEFGNLDNIFAHLDDIKSPKLREKLIEQKKSAIFSKELAILDTNVPVEFDLFRMKVGRADEKKLFKLFKEMEFKKFAEEVAQTAAPREKLTVTNIGKGNVATLLAKIQKQGEFAFLLDYTEGAGSTDCFGMMISLGSSECFYVDAEGIADFKEVLADLKIVKVTHDIKNALKVLVSRGCPIKGKVFDVMLAGYLLAPSKGSYDVKALAWDHLQSVVPDDDRLTHEAYLISKLYEKLVPEIREKELLKLFEEIEIPLAYVLFRMEMAGVKLDEKLLSQMSKECENKIEQLMKKLYKLAGEEFNLNSPKQLAHILFEKLKLPSVRKIKTGFSTDEAVLTKLAAKHELPAIILEYRQLAKLKSTYIDALPKLVNPKTHRLHASFNQTVTETGRLSSSDPNLQNIPIRTELGRQIRKAFIASSKDHLIVAADYSQIELRILAHLSQDKNMIKAFEQDEDIHNYTAAQIFEVKEDKVTPLMRNSAKRVNFGISYGMSAFGLSKDLAIPVGEAQEFIDKYFARYPGVKKFMDNEIKKAGEKGFVLTLLNRRRYLPEINSSNMNIRQFAERQAINTPVQGSAADLLKLAMIHIQQELEKNKMASRMTITVHDELVFDVPKDEKDALVEMVRDKMENVIKLSVPVKATIKTGANWLDLTEVKP